MAKKIDASMPAECDITEGFKLRVTATDPTTGALVSGAVVNTTVIYADPLGEGALESGTFGPFMLVPGPGA